MVQNASQDGTLSENLSGSPFKSCVEDSSIKSKLKVNKDPD